MTGLSRPAGPDRFATPLGRGLVLLGPDGSLLVLRLLVTAMHAARRDGIAPNSDVLTLRTLLDAALDEYRHFAQESGKVSSSSDRATSSLAPSFGVLVDPIGSAETAALLGCSRQWIRARCRRGEFVSARRVGQEWVLERDEVAAFVSRPGS